MIDNPDDGKLGPKYCYPCAHGDHEECCGDCECDCQREKD